MPANTNEPTWAADTNYSSGPRSGRPTKNEMADPDQGFVAGNTIPVDCVNEILNRMCTWLADAERELFGDGSDGIVTIGAGTTTLSRDMYYETLTVQNGGILATNGFRVFVRDLCTINAGGVISSDGLRGGDGTTGNVAGGATRAAGSLAATAAGGQGGADAGGNATAGAGAGACLGGTGGDGGSPVLGGTGGTGGARVAPATNEGLPNQVLDAIRGRSLAGSQWRGGTGGGGGGGGSGVGSNGGGGGGSGGGCLVLVAFRLVNNGTIRALGGAGGDGGTTGNDGNGGGGGGGGLVITVARGRSGSGTISVAGGAHGVPSTLGTATDGAAGQIFELVA